jgi:hypothetical protein
MILLFLIMRCTPTIRELIEATPLSLSSPSATSLSALAPAQRLERSDFVHWHIASVIAAQRHVRCRGETGSNRHTAKVTQLTHVGSSRD